MSLLLGKVMINHGILGYTGYTLVCGQYMNQYVHCNASVECAFRCAQTACADDIRND